MPFAIVGSVTQTRDVAFADVFHVSMSKARGVPSSATKQMSAFAFAGDPDQHGEVRERVAVGGVAVDREDDAAGEAAGSDRLDVRDRGARGQREDGEREEGGEEFLHGEDSGRGLLFKVERAKGKVAG